MNTLLLMGILAAAWMALQAAVLWRASGLLRGGWRRTALVVGVRFIAMVGLWVVLATASDGAAGVLGFVATAITVDACLTCIFLRCFLQGPGKAAVRVWAVQFALGLVLTLTVFAAAGTCLVAGFIPNSSMSPNIRGYHVVEQLPDGTHLVVAANTPGEAGIPPGESSGAIVAETYAYREARRPLRHSFPADRFIWNKTRTPKRWDAVVFAYPGQPDDRFVKRLLGLPGERVEIRDGAVWINGEQLTPPASLGAIRYTATFEYGQAGAWDLGPDACIVLGDNTDTAPIRAIAARSR